MRLREIILLTLPDAKLVWIFIITLSFWLRSCCRLRRQMLRSIRSIQVARHGLGWWSLKTLLEKYISTRALSQQEWSFENVLSTSWTTLTAKYHKHWGRGGKSSGRPGVCCHGVWDLAFQLFAVSTIGRIASTMISVKRVKRHLK